MARASPFSSSPSSLSLSLKRILRGPITPDGYPPSPLAVEHTHLASQLCGHETGKASLGRGDRGERGGAHRRRRGGERARVRFDGTVGVKMGTEKDETRARPGLYVQGYDVQTAWVVSGALRSKTMDLFFFSFLDSHGTNRSSRTEYGDGDCRRSAGTRRARFAVGDCFNWSIGQLFMVPDEESLRWTDAV